LSQAGQALSTAFPLLIFHPWESYGAVPAAGWKPAASWYKIARELAGQRGHVAANLSRAGSAARGVGFDKICLRPRPKAPSVPRVV